MDSIALNSIIMSEIDALSKLLELLEEQHDLLISNDILKLEQIVERIQLCNKAVAESEVERRKLTNNEPMKDLIEESENPGLKENYRKIIKLLHEIKTQKETNDMLIKMGLGYSTRMLNILSPSNSGNGAATYNARGNYKK